MSLQRNVASIKSSQAFRWTVGVGVGAMAALATRGSVQYQRSR